jgi:hypothetical protein
MSKGKCKLCLRDGMDLQDSLFLSAGLYRILRDAGEANPNPWAVTERAVFQTSEQVKAPLICSDCEQRLSKNGENWVLRNCLKADRMVSADLLDGSNTLPESFIAVGHRTERWTD